MLTSRSQRWRERRALYVDNLSTIDPRQYAVDVVEPAQARRFVAEHHYLGSFPASVVSIGLFGPGAGRQSSLRGVAVFAVPSNDDVITAHSGMPSARQGLVLARFVQLDTVAGNGESYHLSRCFKLLKRTVPKVEAVVSYSDPLSHHIGSCYCALSAAYRGRTRPRSEYLIGGRTVNGRTLSKIRTGERGATGAIEQIIALGAPRPRLGEDPPIWLERLKADRLLTRRTHPGLFAYCFELTRRARKLGRDLPRLPYPTVLDLPNPRSAPADHPKA